jgi:predicted O-linked N-acetylglucosamine transferase (SPINDLY family)
MLPDALQTALRRVETAFRGGAPQDLWDACAELLALAPGHAAGCNLAGLAAIGLGREEEGLALLRESTRLEPSNPALWLNLGGELLRFRQPQEALAAFCQPAARAAPGPALLGQGNCLVELDRHEEAAACYRQVRPNTAEALPALHSLATVLLTQGRWQAARELLEGPLAGFSMADSSRLFALHYDPAVSARAVCDAHAAWGRRFPDLLAPRPASADPGRRLRVGYVSPDFRQHSCAYFFEPLLTAHDRGQVELFLYSEAVREDATTARLKALADHWRATSGRADAAVAAAVAADRIDILVDLAGHTSGNRLGVFAQRPAPLQLTWLGYPGSTGLGSFNGRLTDAWADPPGVDEFATEPLLRLPHFLCYGPPGHAPLPGPPPCLQGRPPTFGSFNAPAKLNDAVLDLWGRLLQRVPAAQLLLKGRGLGDAETRSWIVEAFQQRGIAAERIDCRGWTPDRESPLACYHQLDVALDPFPYNGATTTCEALWMGVPVVTLAGDRHAARVGISLLQAAGLADWIATSEEDYLRIAESLIAAPDRLAAERQTLRARLQASPLLDAASFARAVEGMYRQLWQKTLAREDSWGT